MLTIYLDVQGVLQSIDAIKNHKQTGDVNGLSFLNNELFVENEKVDLIRKFCIDNNAQVILISAATSPYSVSYNILLETLKLPLVSKDIQEDYYNTETHTLKGEMVNNHVNKYGFENHIIFDDQWQNLFDGYWRRCVRKIDPKTGIDERSINNANRVIDLNSKK